jgi:hypothetical protein
MKTRLYPTLLLLLLCTQLSACAVVAIADAAVSVVANTVSIAADVVGGTVDLLIPDGDEAKTE